jgi:hypothetical protein
MPPALVARLLDEAERLWGFAGIEITLEGNPSSVEAANYAALAAARGSTASRSACRRSTTQRCAFWAASTMHAEGLAALEIGAAPLRPRQFRPDLCAPRPDAGKQWRAELAARWASGTGHLSLYQLTIEPGTRFATMVRQGEFIPLDDDAAADLFALTRADDRRRRAARLRRSATTPVPARKAATT